MATAAAFLPLTDDQKVDARALHGWLGIATRFTTWMQRLIDDYGFEEGEDFLPNLGKTSAKGGRPTKEYLLSLDVAKEIAMIGNTPKGKATRRYFIAAEKAAAKMASGDHDQRNPHVRLQRRPPARDHHRRPAVVRRG